MSQDEVERFLGKVVLDHSFSREATKSIKEACDKAGIDITPGEMQCLARSKFTLFAGFAAVMRVRFYKRFSR